VVNQKIRLAALSALLVSSIALAAALRCEPTEDAESGPDPLPASTGRTIKPAPIAPADVQAFIQGYVGRTADDGRWSFDIQGRPHTLNLLAIENSTIRRLGPTLYSGQALFRDSGTGLPVRVLFVVDSAADLWRLAGFQIIGSQIGQNRKKA